MPEHANLDCINHCRIVTGPVFDVCEVMKNYYPTGTVVTVNSNGQISSKPLADLGEASESYLDAIRSCNGPEKVSRIRRSDCAAMMGEYSLEDYVR